MPCSGNVSETCGGDISKQQNANDVYLTNLSNIYGNVKFIPIFLSCLILISFLAKIASPGGHISNLCLHTEMCNRSDYIIDYYLDYVIDYVIVIGF